MGILKSTEKRKNIKIKEIGYFQENKAERIYTNALNQKNKENSKI